MKSQQNPYLLRAVDWNEVFPWLILRKCLRFGFSLRLLTCVTLNLVVCIAIFSWAFSERVFQTDGLGWDYIDPPGPPYSFCLVEYNYFLRTMEHCNELYVNDIYIAPPEKEDLESLENDVYLSFRMSPSHDGVIASKSYNKFFGYYRQEQAKWRDELFTHFDGRSGLYTRWKIEDVRNHYHRYGVNVKDQRIEFGEIYPGIHVNKTWVNIATALFIAFNFFFIQLIIARMTTVRIATGVRPSLFHAAMMARKHIVSAVIAAVLMAVGVALVLAPMWITSLLPEFLTTIAAPISLLCAFAGVFMILGTVLGLPLMLSALMSENSDYFDAMSRAYSYALQRPLRYGFYLLVGLFYGVIGRLAMCAVTWAAVALFFYVSGKDPVTEQSLYVWFFVYVAGLLPLAFTVIYTCSLFSGIYMLLRRDVDAVEMDEVWLPKSQGVPLPELPRLKSDPRGEPN